MSWLTRHWELKFVALVIALGLWQYTNGQVRVDYVITVTVTDNAVFSLPNTYQVSSIEPREFTLHVSAPVSRESSFRTDGLIPRLVISTDALEKGTQTFQVNNRNLGLHDDIRIAFDPETPHTITVNYYQIAIESLPVEVPRLEKIPAGLNASLHIDRTQVKVSGARSRLNELRESGYRIKFRPVSLEGVDPQLTSPHIETLVLIDQDPLVRVTENVLATINLTPKDGSPRVVTLPVALLAQPSVWAAGAVDVNPARVVLTLHGPANLLAGLTPETDLAAYISLARLPEAGTAMMLPVEIKAPAWLTADPVSVTVTLHQK